MQTTPPVVQETLPIAAQYGVLGLLCLAFGFAVVYLVWKLDRVRTEHAEEVRRIYEDHKKDLALLNAERVKETGEYAQALAELLQPVEGVVGQVEEIAKELSRAAAERTKRAERGDPRRRATDDPR